MFERVRVLPAVIATLALLMSLKVVSVWTGLDRQLSPVRTAYASSAKTEGEHEEPVEAKREADSHNAENRSANHAPGYEESVDLPQYLSSSEVDLMNSLADRRLTIEQREKELNLRERMIAATEMRVDEKIGELKALEATINAALDAKEQAEDEQMKSLVKMYETMKAQDAARIFERLDQDVLLSVVKRMKASKMAAVMSKMTPQAAKELTTALAKGEDYSLTQMIE